MSIKSVTSPKKRKLLVFHQSLAPYRVDFWNYLNEKYDLRLYFLNKNHLDQKFDQEKLKASLNFKCYYLGSGVKIGTRVFRWGLTRIIRRFNPDVIFTYEYSQTTTSVVLLRQLFNFKYTIYSICDDSIEIAKSCSGLRKIFRDRLVERLDGLIVVNKEVAQWYSSNFHLKSPAIVFPIIVREEGFREDLDIALDASNHLMQDLKILGKKCIFFVGRLVKVKGIDRLLQAFSLVHKEFPETIIILIGEGNQEDNLKELSQELGIEKKVLFVGRHERPELFSWFNIGQIFVLPSSYEPFGAVVNEALLAGATVICSKSAGSSSLITPGVNGETFDPFNITALSTLLSTELNKVSTLTSLSKIRPSKMLVSFDDFTANVNV